jgi:hypothetical protein
MTMRRSSLLFLLACTVGVGCSALRGGGQPEGRLRVNMTDVVINGTAAVLRGSVLNEFSEQVEGVRYVVLVRDPDQANLVYERFDREADTVIAPGARADMALEVEGESLDQPKFRIVINAMPVKVGGRAYAE